jgi:hypothetical protein
MFIIKKIIFLSVILALAAPLFFLETEEAQLQRFLSKYFTKDSPYYNAEDKMSREIQFLNPANKTAVYRLIRKNEAERYKSIKGETDKEYLKGKQLDELFTIAEDISLKEKGVCLMDLTENQLKVLMREAVRRYPGELIIEDLKVLRNSESDASASPGSR